MSESEVLSRLRRDGQRISKRFRLRYLDILSEDHRVWRRFGSCDENGVIRLRLYNAGNGRFLSYRCLLDTLCHEMAHLRYMDHGPDFKHLHKKIWGWVKDRGIHRRSL